MPPISAAIADIEARQDEVLRQLDELNAKLERALAEFGGLSIAGVKPPPAGQVDQPATRRAAEPLPRAA